MEMITDKQGAIQYIVLQGKLDGATAAEFEKTAEQLLHEGVRLFIIDAQDLEYFSSSGIGSIVKWIRSLERAGGSAAMTGASSEIRHLFDFFGLSKHVPMFSSLGDAEKHLNNRGNIHSNLSILTSAPGESSAFRRARKLDTSIGEFNRQSGVIEPQATSTVQNQTSTPSVDALGRNLENLQKSLEKVIDSLDRIPGTIYELRGGTTKTASLFGEPFLIDCKGCGSALRIKKTGDHLCPKCAARFNVGQDRSVHFFEKSSWQAPLKAH